MRKVLSVLVFITCVINVSAQLDPFFYGTYTDAGMTKSYTVYSMDEVAEDCFLVEYEKYENYETVFGASGSGKCDGKNGHMEIKLESSEYVLEVDFGLEDNGQKIMTIFNEDSTVFVYKAVVDEYPEEEMYEEFYYSREDGAEIMLYADMDGLGFTIYGLLDGMCDINEISGELTPLNDDLTTFIYKDESGCKIEFQMSEGIIRIVEANCEKMRKVKCKDYNGVYYLNE